MQPTRKPAPEPSLSRRERQIMDILFASERMTAQDVQQRLADAPSYSTVRTLLRVLEQKGHIRHIEDGPRYVYLPVITREKARRSAMQRLLSTFFDGSAKEAAVAFLNSTTTKLSDDDLNELEQMIRTAREERTK